jgi:Bacterial membrane protein YfhO
MNKNFFRDHAIAIAILLLAVIVFCLPAVQGLILNSHDFVSWRYMSNESKTFNDANGGPALWTNSMFGGMPSYTTYGSQSGNVITDFTNFLAFGIPRPIFLLFMCAVSFYVLACAFSFKLGVRILGALAFTFSSYLPILASAGHDGKLSAIGYTAGVLAGLIFLLNGKKWTGIATYTIFFCLLFSTGHYQIIYYAIVLLAIIGLTVLINSFRNGTFSKTISIAGILILCSIVGALTQSYAVLLIQDYTKSTMRGGQSEMTIGKKNIKKTNGLEIEYAFRWSQGVGETFSLLVSDVMGPIDRKYFAEGATSEKLTELGMSAEIANQLPNYWGPQPFVSGAVYFGAITIFLFMLGLFVVKSIHKWWIVIGTIIFTMLSWGKNFGALNNLLFEYLPMYNKFRTPSMSLVIPQLLMPLLGIWGLHEIIMGKINKEDAWKYLKISTIITIALALIGGVFSNMWQSFEGESYAPLMDQLTKAFGGNAEKAKSLYSAMKLDMAVAVRADGIRSIVFILLAAALIWAVLKDKLKPTIAVIALCGLMVIDLFMVDKRSIKDEQYMDTDTYQSEMFGARAVDNQILADKDPYYRVHDLSTDPFNDARPAYFHKLVGGYHPAKMQVYQDMIDVHISKNNREVLNMMNTKYIIVPGQNNQPQVMPNPNACGNAWFVNEIKMVKTADEEILALNAPSLSNDGIMKGNFNPRVTAVVRETFNKNIVRTNFTKDSSAQIKLTKYAINDLEFTSSNTQDGFAVFSDIYYNGGWKCLVDGKETTIIKTNYILRGINIPAGNHKIEWHFAPQQAKTGRSLALLGSALTLLFLFVGLYMAYKKGEFEENINKKL